MNSKIDNKPLGSITITLGILCWSGTTILYRIWSSESIISPYLFMLLRYILATILVGIAWFFGKGYLERINKKEMMMLAFLGIFGIGYHNLSLYMGLKTIDASLGAVILAIAPIFGEILELIVYKEKKLHFQTILWSLISLLGVAVVVGLGYSSIDLVALLLVISSTIALATYNVFASRLMETSTITSKTVTFYTIGIGTTLFIPMTFLDSITTGIESTFSSIDKVSYWLSIIYMAFIGIMIGRSFYNYGVEKAGPKIATLLMNLSPIFTTILGILLLEENITIGFLIGSIIIIISVMKVISIENGKEGYLKT